MIASISTWMNTKQIPIKIIQLVTVLGYLVEVLVSSTSCHSYLRWLSWGIFFLTSRQTVMELYELWTNLRTHIEVNLSCVLWLLEAQLVQISGNAKTMRSFNLSHWYDGITLHKIVQRLDCPRYINLNLIVYHQWQWQMVAVQRQIILSFSSGV